MNINKSKVNEYETREIRALIPELAIKSQTDIKTVAETVFKSSTIKRIYFDKTCKQDLQDKLHFKITSRHYDILHIALRQYGIALIRIKQCHTKSRHGKVKHVSGIQACKEYLANH